MKKENLYRQAAIESMIQRSADGLLHIAPKQGETKTRRFGPEPYQNTDEIKICLSCPLKECILEKNEYCSRLRAELRRKRKEKKNDKSD